MTSSAQSPIERFALLERARRYAESLPDSQPKFDLLTLIDIVEQADPPSRPLDMSQRDGWLRQLRITWFPNSNASRAADLILELADKYYRGDYVRLNHRGAETMPDAIRGKRRALLWLIAHHGYQIPGKRRLRTIVGHPR
jgi:hypothetical protein